MGTLAPAQNGKPGPGSRPRTTYRPDFVDLIPKELRERAQWVVWRYSLNEDRTRWTKIPYQARHVSWKASSTNPAHRSTFDQALGAYLKHRDGDGAGRVDGIGYVFSHDDPYVGIDLDACLDGNREVKPWARRYVAKLLTYGEVSPSGNGVKFIARAELPGGGHKKTGFGDDLAGAVEMYQEGRFFTITGDTLDGNPTTVEDLTSTVREIHDEVWPPKAKPESKAGPASASTRAALPESDEELLRIAYSAQGGTELQSLYLGNVPAGKTLSEATAALLFRLAFWTAKDTARMDRMFRASGLMRDKWDERRGGSTWGGNEIEGAIRVVSDVYTPGAHQGNGRGSVRTTPPDGPPPGEPPPSTSRSLHDELAKRPQTDLGNAERLVARNGRDLRYCHPWKKWLTWDKQRWRLDNTAEIRRRAYRTVRNMLSEAKTIDDKDKRKALILWSLESESRGRLAAMISLAEAQKEIPVLPENLDQNPWLLNCRNGTLELRTGLLREHRREDNITQLCPVVYDGGADCPMWNATMMRVFGGDLDLIGFFQRMCGVILTGTVTEQILPICHGSGANGKSTLMNTLIELLGPDYAMKAPPDLLMAKGKEAHPTERADLHGKRLIVAIETGEGCRINETLIKELTGSDRIRARRMREDFWEFKPTHKLVLCTNHKPVVRGTDHAIWRRLTLIPFNVKIDDAEADKDMPAKLLGELPGILAWCVRGCLDWQEDGLNPPQAVKVASQKYREEEDVLRSFLEENCVILVGTRTKASRLFDRYRKWAERAGEPPFNQTRFGTAMTERGFEKLASNGIWYQGIGLRDESTD